MEATIRMDQTFLKYRNFHRIDGESSSGIFSRIQYVATQ